MSPLARLATIRGMILRPDGGLAVGPGALFNLTIDSKLRACDLVKLRVEDLWSGSSIRDWATIVQYKTTRVMQFEDNSRLKSHLRDARPRSKDRRQLAPNHRANSVTATPIKDV